MAEIENLTNTEDEEIPIKDIIEALENRLGRKQFVFLRHEFQTLKKIGLLGDHSLLHITLINAEGNVETVTFFVKFFPKLEAPAEFAEKIGAFKKEMFIYELFEKFRNNDCDFISSVTPRCYLSRYNKYLILDNIIEEGFELVDKYTFLDYPSVLAVLQSLAKFHAASIVYEENNNKSLLRDHEEDFKESFFNTANIKGITASIVGIIKEIEIFEFPPEVASGKSFAKLAEKTCYKIYDLVKPSSRFRNVLSHGDLWATNFLLKRDTRTHQVTGCKFVDFQCSRYVPPSQDVLSLIYLTTSREFRDRYLYGVVGIYYSYLEKHLKFAGLDSKKVLPFSEFIDSCKEQEAFAIVETAIYFPLILIGDDVIQEYFSDKHLNEKALFKDRSYLVLAHMNKDEEYKNRIKDSISDLKDYCEFL